MRMPWPLIIKASSAFTRAQRVCAVLFYRSKFSRSYRPSIAAVSYVLCGNLQHHRARISRQSHIVI